MWELEETLEFEKEYHKLPPTMQSRFQEQFKKLKENPYGIGKPLGFPWFRELKNDGFRVYYLIYDQQILVLFVGVSTKRNQQQIIDIVKKNLKLFKEFVDNRTKKL